MRSTGNGSGPGLLPPPADPSENGLLVQFREFYTELLRLKDELAIGGRHLDTGDRATDPQDPPGIIHQRLCRLLERQALAAAERGGTYGRTLHHEAQFLMAALADEHLLHDFQWSGRELWRDRLLETALFGSRFAGERVFERLDELLAEGSRFDPDLATVYLITLSLGFRGRFWRREDEPELRRYRVALAQVISRHDPALTREVGPVFQQAYGHTLEEGRAVRLPHLRPWLAAMAAVITLFLIGTHLIWADSTADIARLVDRTTTVPAER